MKIPRSLELEEGEQPLGSWTCGIPSSPESSTVKYEGTLVLTDRRVLYEPFGLLRVLGFGGLGGPRASFQLDLVQRAAAVDGRVPRLRIVLHGGDPFVVIVSGSRFSLPWSKRKWIALEDVVERINALIG